MGDLSRNICNDCGRTHPELEDCCHYDNMPVDQEWASERYWTERGYITTRELDAIPPGQFAEFRRGEYVFRHHSRSEPSWRYENPEIGYQHTPEIKDGAYTVGHAGPLETGYNQNQPMEWKKGPVVVKNLCAEIEMPSHPETIVAAAVRVPTSDEWRAEMWRGKRSYPDFLIISAAPPARHPSLMHPLSDHGHRVGPSDQGFITSTGRYVDRTEAKRIVIASNQPRVADNPTWDTLPELYSEDLW